MTDTSDLNKPQAYLDIVKKYPRVFSHGDTINLGRTGWKDIIDRVCYFISMELDRLPEDVTQGIYAAQVKSKFGGLRFYMSHDTPFIDGVISIAEAISLHTCEECGDKGKPVIINGYLSTLCLKHKEIEEAYAAEKKARWEKENAELSQEYIELDEEYAKLLLDD